MSHTFKNIVHSLYMTKSFCIWEKSVVYQLLYILTTIRNTRIHLLFTFDINIIHPNTTSSPYAYILNIYAKDLDVLSHILKKIQKRTFFESLFLLITKVYVFVSSIVYLFKWVKLCCESGRDYKVLFVSVSLKEFTRI